MAAIDETISAASPNSKEVSGGEISAPGSRSQTQLPTAQVVPSGVGAFEVELQHAVNGSQLDFTKIGSWDQDSETFGSVFPVSQGVFYRFRHVSGVACRVKLSG